MTWLLCICIVFQFVYMGVCVPPPDAPLQELVALHFGPESFLGRDQGRGTATGGFTFRFENASADADQAYLKNGFVYFDGRRESYFNIEPPLSLACGEGESFSAALVFREDSNRKEDRSGETILSHSSGNVWVCIFNLCSSNSRF